MGKKNGMKWHNKNWKKGLIQKMALIRKKSNLTLPFEWFKHNTLWSETLKRKVPQGCKVGRNVFIFVLLSMTSRRHATSGFNDCWQNGCKSNTLPDPSDQLSFPLCNICFHLSTTLCCILPIFHWPVNSTNNIIFHIMVNLMAKNKEKIDEICSLCPKTL